MRVPDSPSRRPRSRDRPQDLARLLGFDRLNIFVPAIMGVGLLFWLLGELRDLVQSLSDVSRNKRARLVGDSITRSMPWPSVRSATPNEQGLRSRPVYVLLAVLLVSAGIYVAVGSVLNYARPNGYLSDIAWLLSLALLVSVALTVLGIVAGVTALRWPDPPRWTERLLVVSLLTTGPIDTDAELERPSRRLGYAFLTALGASFALTLLVVRGPAFVVEFDERLASLFGWWSWPSGVTDVLFGRLGVVSLVVIVSVAALRCRALTAAYATATGIAFILGAALRAVVDRSRPPFGPRAGDVDSFPSGHVMQAVLISVLLPVAIGVLFDRRAIPRVFRLTLVLLALVAGLDRVASGEHWPTDVIGGALIGATLGLGGLWVVSDQRAHARCRSCPWEIAGPIQSFQTRRDLHHLIHRGRPAHPARGEHPHVPLGLIQLSHQSSQLIAGAAHIASFAVVIGLAILTLTVGLPQNGEGYVFGASVERPAQYVLAGIVSIGALLGRRWPAPGAVLIAFAAACMGVFASIEYQPAYAVALAGVVMVPAFLLWLSWQHRRTALELTVVAALTVVLLGATWLGARAVYDQYFGPTHPDSEAAAISVDEVEWVLAGRLRSDSITVSARLVDVTRRAMLEVRSADDSQVISSPPTSADRFGIAKFTIDGLLPGSDYDYRVLVDGVPDEGRGYGEFRTPADGAMSFDVVLASCARTGSNGAVFDAMTEEDALLYLALGDAHYGNIDSTEVGPFLDAYDYMLTRPGQAAFYRSTPLAYVWDDHDYGPNDADSSAPGRAAVARAYRSVVPSADLVDEVSIYQAFTIGRVRFVMTDARSQKTAETMLGDAQRAWLIDELTTASRTHALVVWANSVPWVGEARAGGDGWSGYADERRAIADAMDAADVDNLVMVSGDAHMVALDDGTNTGYSSRGGGGFPLLHAAPLDRPASIKGGPYSGGVYAASGQYGTMRITDEGGDEVAVTLAGHSWDGRTLVEQTFRFPVAIE